MLNKVCRRAELPYLEARYALNSNACYQRHSHPTFSLGVVETGQSHHYQRGKTQRIGSGAVVATQPDTVHNCNPLNGQQWSYHMLYVDCDWLTALAGQMKDAGNTAVQTMPQVPAVVYDRALYKDIISLNREFFFSASALQTQTRLTDIFSRLLHRHAAADDATLLRASHPAVNRAREYLHDYACESVTLDELATVVQLSPYHLIRLFKREIGLTPHAYQIDVRINRAKQLLRAQVPIAQVAAETAFSDQAHFQRSFKRHTAMTPAQYQRAH